MILARNLRLPLNGSKHIFLLIVVALLLESCAIFQHGRVQKDPDVIIPSEQTNQGTTKGEKPTDVVVKEPKDTINEEIKKDKSERFKVALIMPFNTDRILESYKTEYDGENEAESEYVIEEISGEAEKSINFYEGLLFGLKKLERKGLKVDLYVYDSNKSDFEINRILEKKELKEMDLIIGPMYNNISSKVAAFAKANKIYHVLPFSPSASITSDNPYHIKVNPTIDVHCKNMYNYIADNFAGKNIVIIYRDRVNEINLSNTFFELSMNTNDEMLPPKMLLYDKNDFNLDEWLNEEDKNVVIVASLSEVFAQNMTRQLHLKQRQYDITVFGMPTWLSSKSLNLDYFESLEFHTSQHLWVDQEDKNVKELSTHFRENLNTDPDNAAFTGFDIGYYFGFLLKNFGNEFPEQLGMETYYGLSTNFDFEPKLTKTNDIQYYENSYVRIVKFENYELHPVE